MDLLVLGGGGFLGYHVVDQAMEAGHRVTVLSRSGRAPRDGVEVLQGDRTGDLSALDGARGWDAVLDTFSDPSAVERTARLLAGRVGAYGYVSGMSVYHPDGPAIPDEDAPVRVAGERAADPLQARSEAKLACEAAVRASFDGPVLVLRPGIMVGPRDPSDRFTSWPVRLAAALRRGEERVLAPGDPSRPVQFSDARDIARWAVTALSRRLDGTFNAVGPGRAESLADVLAACLQAAREETGLMQAELALTWVPEDRLAAALAGVEEEARALWCPEPQIPQRAIDSSRAAGEGLAFRPALETARETLAWFRAERRDERSLAAGIPEAVEAELVSAAR